MILAISGISAAKIFRDQRERLAPLEFLQISVNVSAAKIIMN